MDIKELEQIITILKKNEVTDFELNKGDIHIKLSREKLARAALVEAAPTNSAPQLAIQPAISGVAPAAQAVTAAPAINPNLVKVESPIVGTFYRRSSPDAEPFVSEGARVEKGDTLCIIEAMKLMNEIEAPRSGKIEKVMLSDGQVVEYGEVLFLINPD